MNDSELGADPGKPENRRDPTRAHACVYAALGVLLALAIVVGAVIVAIVMLAGLPWR